MSNPSTPSEPPSEQLPHRRSIFRRRPFRSGRISSLPTSRTPTHLFTENHQTPRFPRSNKRHTTRRQPRSFLGLKFRKSIYDPWVPPEDLRTNCSEHAPNDSPLVAPSHISFRASIDVTPCYQSGWQSRRTQTVRSVAQSEIVSANPCDTADGNSVRVKTAEAQTVSLGSVQVTKLATPEKTGSNFPRVASMLHHDPGMSEGLDECKEIRAERRCNSGQSSPSAKLYIRSPRREARVHERVQGAGVARSNVLYMGEEKEDKERCDKVKVEDGNDDDMVVDCGKGAVVNDTGVCDDKTSSTFSVKDAITRWTMQSKNAELQEEQSAKMLSKSRKTAVASAEGVRKNNDNVSVSQKGEESGGTEQKQSDSCCATKPGQVGDESKKRGTMCNAEEGRDQAVSRRDAGKSYRISTVPKLVERGAKKRTSENCSESARDRSSTSIARIQRGKKGEKVGRARSEVYKTDMWGLELDARRAWKRSKSGEHIRNRIKKRIRDGGEFFFAEEEMVDELVREMVDVEIIE